MIWASEVFAAGLFLSIVLAIPYSLAKAKNRSGFTAVLLTLFCWPVGYAWAILTGPRK
jgi:hypothetical protein